MHSPSIASVYSSNEPSPDHIAAINGGATKPTIPRELSYGVDSPLELISSPPLPLLYFSQWQEQNSTRPALTSIGLSSQLYTAPKDKHYLWNFLLSSLPDGTFTHPTLDAGCSRGMALLKVAQRKAALSSTTTSTPTPSSPAYGIDNFSAADQSSNAPSATWTNATATSFVTTTTTSSPSPGDGTSRLDLIVLHTASFTATLPLRDGDAFGVVTSELAVHDVGLAATCWSSTWRATGADTPSACGGWAGRVRHVAVCDAQGEEAGVRPW